MRPDEQLFVMKSKLFTFPLSLIAAKHSASIFSRLKNTRIRKTVRRIWRRNIGVIVADDFIASACQKVRKKSASRHFSSVGQKSLRKYLKPTKYVFWLTTQLNRGTMRLPFCNLTNVSFRVGLGSVGLAWVENKCA